jgi:hypothetical protein
MIATGKETTEMKGQASRKRAGILSRQGCWALGIAVVFIVNAGSGAEAQESVVGTSALCAR